MSTLDKIKKARQSVVTIDGHDFTIRRPTPVEFLACPIDWLRKKPEGDSKEWFADQINLRSPDWRDAAWHMVTHFVDGWDLCEIDLIPGGTNKPEPFEVAVFSAWLEENPGTLSELALTIYNVAFEHQFKLAEAKKKLTNGLNPDESPSLSLAE